MSPDPSDGAAGSAQAAFDKLNALLASADAAAINPANTKEARDAAFDLRTATSAQLDALNQAVITGNTVQLQAAADEMKPGMEELKELKKKIEGIGNGLKEATAIISGIDSAISELGKLP
jgi:hypothetical protein